MINRRALLATLFSLSCVALAPSLALAKDFTSGRISVQTSGAGSDVILIPGLGSSPRVWAEMI